MKKEMAKLAELHSHLGSAVQPHIMWSIAHEQGIKLPTKDYWEFANILTIKKSGQYHSFGEINTHLFKLSELIQSSPLAIKPAVHGTIGGAYRNSNIVLHELRFCPAKRNRQGERDLDHIILAAIHGLEQAKLEYPEIKAGIILMLDREFDPKLNEIIYNKAKKYQSRGIIGIDLAGPQRKGFNLADLKHIFLDAKKSGFGVTIHTGEEGDLEEMRYCVKELKPHRIGHGFMAWQDKKLMKELVKKNICLELCPTSNLFIGHFKDYDELKTAYRTLYEAGVQLTINTDGPEFYNSNLQKEIQSLIDNDVFTTEEIEGIIKNSFGASFIK